MPLIMGYSLICLIVCTSRDRWLAVLARLLSLAIIVLIGKWVDKHLGGVAPGPDPDGKGGNDTTR